MPVVAITGYVIVCVCVKHIARLSVNNGTGARTGQKGQRFLKKEYPMCWPI